MAVSRQSYNRRAITAAEAETSQCRRLTLKRPLRHRPTEERSLEEQIVSLTPSELEVVNALKEKWEIQPRVPYHFNDAMYLRFARFTKFNAETAWGVMKRYDIRYLNLRATDLEEQLLTRTLFIPPGLKTKDNHDVFYMRPSRYFPKRTPTSVIIDNLAYCMNVMVEKEKPCTEGIGFLANMDGWELSNFSLAYCNQFMKMLQGRTSVRVRLFLIVNPPSWFGVIWEIMKLMLTKKFQKKVHIIPASDLPKFLAEGYEEYLPNELEGGMVNADEIVNDFVAYRKVVESISSAQGFDVRNHMCIK